MDATATNETAPGLWDDKTAAAYLGMSPAWLKLERYKKTNDGPAYIMIGKSIRYRREDLDRYIEAGTVKHGAPNNGKG